MSKEKGLDRTKVPEDFTLGLALVDAVPVVLFGVNALILGRIFGSGLFIFGALLCLLGGGGKVLWKIIVAGLRKNIWFLFVQMRIVMPAGFILMLVSLAVDREKVSPSGMWQAFTGMPSLIFFLLGILGMIMMSVFAVKLDNSDVRSNWIEQITNGFSQLAFLIALCLIG